MPSLVTHIEPFFPCNPRQDQLFAVRPGAPLKDALDIASCILETATHAITHAAAQHDDQLLHGAIFQLDAVKAVLNSANRAMSANRQSTESEAPTNPSTPSPRFAIARLETLQKEAEQLAAIEIGQAKAFNQGRAGAFALALDALMEVES